MLAMEWKTKDGQVLRFDQMDDSHLLNTLNMLMRKIRLNHNAILDKSNDFYLDFGMDYGVASAINLGGKEYEEIENCKQKISEIIAELAQRKCQFNFK